MCQDMRGASLTLQESCKSISDTAQKNTLRHIKCNFDLYDLNQNWQLKSSFCICLSEAPEEKAPFNDDHLFTINLHK